MNTNWHTANNRSDNYTIEKKKALLIIVVAEDIMVIIMLFFWLFWISLV
jgi:hypothetical protein